MTSTAEQSKDPSENIAIIGGGITGLFCAYALAEAGHQVKLFESTRYFGGRIRSLRLNEGLLTQREQITKGCGQPIADKATLEEALKVDKKGKLSDHLEFCAEFGPMRVELEVQVLLKFLLQHLEIAPIDASSALPETLKLERSLDAVRMESFPPFTSPASTGDPVYDLKPEEEGKTPLDLLSLGLCRTIVELTFNRLEDNDPDYGKYEEFERKRRLLIYDLAKAAGTYRPTGPVFEAWLKTLSEDDYWVIQRYGCVPIGYTSGAGRAAAELYRMGFWNLLAGYLSHNALSKVRDLGTFYHLLPENPNAAEWLTWWLRQFSISGKLQGIFGGMQSITEKILQDKMHIPPNYVDPERPIEPKEIVPKDGALKLRLHINSQVTDLKLTKDKKQVVLEVNDVWAKAEDASNRFDRIIIALPKAPAQTLAASSELLRQVRTDTPGAEETLANLLDSALGFPMVKIFFVVRERWWEQAKRANWGATRYPTREVHFYKSRLDDSHRGMVMLYTDRPASSFWANYVPAGYQYDIDELCDAADAQGASENPGDLASTREILRARLKSRLAEYINENEGPGITVDDIIWCGIMDWGRLPYGAGNHAWRPEIKYWKVMAELGNMRLGSDREAPELHVCGEAYSDYHGFIEGSLRSAFYALTRILRPASNSDSGASSASRSQAMVKDILTLLDKEMPEGFWREEDNGVLTRDDKQPKLTRDEQYIEDLVDWINNLERARQPERVGTPPAQD